MSLNILLTTCARKEESEISLQLHSLTFGILLLSCLVIVLVKSGTLKHYDKEQSYKNKSPPTTYHGFNLIFNTHHLLLFILYQYLYSGSLDRISRVELAG